MINKSIFDNYNGQEIYKYTLSDNRLQADIITFGATVTALRVNTGKKWVDVALGFESVEDQIKKGDYMGAGGRKMRQPYRRRPIHTQRQTVHAGRQQRNQSSARRV